MEKIIAQLEAILKRLGTPQDLETPEFEGLNRDWLTATAQLGAMTEGALRDAVAADPFLKPRLQLLVERLPWVSSGLIRHKTEVADQLAAHNRKMQSARQGYGRQESGVVLVRHQA